MFEKSIVNQKLVVQPVFISLVHLNAFMGPCRYGIGEELTYDYEMKQAQKTFQHFKDDCDTYLDEKFVEVLEPKFLEWHEDFAISEEVLREALKEDYRTDVYLISGTRLLAYVSTVIAKRTKKPLLFVPLSGSKYSRRGGYDASAHLTALHQGYETFNALDYDDLNRFFRILRARKVIKNMKVMYGLRNNVLSFGCVSSFINLQDVTNRFGTEIVNFNAREILTMMDELTDEEVAEARKIADDLLRDANGVHMPAENFINDTKYFVAVRKLMKMYDCNAFTQPCFEMCATMELNRRHLTFCLTHCLNKDDGVPSSCASDINTLICYSIIMSIARKAPYMGNVMVCLEDKEHKLCRINHDMCSKKMKGFDEPDLPIDYVSFAKGNWGVTMRYNFAEDLGQDINLINISPDMKRILITKAKIAGCDDWLTQECSEALVFEVSDNRKFHEKVVDYGHHHAVVYGDYSEDFAAFAKLMGMEVEIVE